MSAIRKIYSSESRNVPTRIQKRFDIVRREYDEQGMVIRARELVLQKSAMDPTKEMIIEGFANYAQPDRWDEIIPKDAWDLMNYLKNPQFLREHDWTKIIGKALEIIPKVEGLWYRASLGDPNVYPLTMDQMEARSLVAQGMLRMNSVGFIPHQWEWDEQTEILKYLKVELLENSLVAIPMQQDSAITSIKHWRKKTVAKENEENQGDDMAQVKAMLKENTDCTKAVHDMVTKMSKSAEDAAKKDEDIKRLTAELATAKTALEAKTKAFDDLEKETGALLDDLEKKGLLPKSAVETK